MFYWNITGQSGAEPEAFVLRSQYECSIEISQAVRHRSRRICTPFTQWTFYWNITGQSGTEPEAFVLRSQYECSIEISQGSQAQNQRHLYSVHNMNVLLKYHRAVGHRTRGICTPFTLWKFYLNITGQSGTEPGASVFTSHNERSIETPQGSQAEY